MNKDNKEKHLAKFYWFTGQAGSGKTVLANILKNKLDSKFDCVDYKEAIIIDGDDIRDIYQNTDYSLSLIHI